MDSVPGLNRRLESVISILLLAILFFVAVGIFIKQSPEHTDSWSSLLPEGYEELTEIELYEPDTLYEKINGKAPLYLDAGFVKLTTQRFVSQTDEKLVMELYMFDMATARNAFSVYSVQKRDDVENLPDMGFAYKTSNAFYLVHGQYYIELLGFTESQELLGAMGQVAKNIFTAVRVRGEKDKSEIEQFPQDDLVKGSIKLYLNNAFGYEGLTDTFTAMYEVNGEPVTAFLSKRANTKEAEAIAKSYVDFLIENGAKPKKALNENLEGNVFDFYDTTEIVLSSGPFVVGIHEAENQEAAEKMVLRFIDKLVRGRR